MHSSPATMVSWEGQNWRERKLSPKIGKVHTNVWSEDFKATGLLKRLREDRKELLKFIFEEQSITMWTG